MYRFTSLHHVKLRTFDYQTFLRSDQLGAMFGMFVLLRNLAYTAGIKAKGPTFFLFYPGKKRNNTTYIIW